MTKHTTGRWEVDGRYVVNADHHLFSKLSNVPEEEIEANLRLAAAAPELLAALKLAQTIIGFGKERDQIDAAIAKATGEQA